MSKSMTNTVKKAHREQFLKVMRCSSPCLEGLGLGPGELALLFVYECARYGERRGNLKTFKINQIFTSRSRCKILRFLVDLLLETDVLYILLDSKISALFRRSLSNHDVHNGGDPEPCAYL